MDGTEQGRFDFQGVCQRIQESFEKRFPPTEAKTCPGCRTEYYRLCFSGFCVECESTRTHAVKVVEKRISAGRQVLDKIQAIFSGDDE